MNSYKIGIAPLFGFILVSCSNPNALKPLLTNIDPKLNIGDYPLAEDQRSLTADGSMHVIKNDGGQILIIFKTWIGKGRDMKGYLYASSPLTKDEIFKDYYGQDVISAFDIQLPFQKTDDPHWYYVEFGLD